MCVYILREKARVESISTYLQGYSSYVVKFLKASNVYGMILFCQNKEHKNKPL